MASAPPPSVWLAGDTLDADFAPTQAWLATAADCSYVAAGHAPWNQTVPDAIVLFQSRPDSIGQRDIERLHRLAPLARLVVVAGPWCEGELRSGRPPHGVTRILWHQWNQRLPQELGLARAGNSVNYPRVRTLTPVDRLLQMLVRPAVTLRGQAAVAIGCSRHDRLDALTDLCAFAGLSIAQQADQAAVCIVDSWEHLPQPMTGRPVLPPVILLLDWPRASDLEQAKERGVAAVLGQPLLVTDLLEAIGSLLPADARASAA